MYGYIKPSVPDLRVREHELYKAMYCGLCRALKLHICRSSTFTLSYDLVFLAIVRSCIASEKLDIKWRRCFAHPFKKRQVVEPTDQITYSAKASALLTYYKICDDRTDEKGLSKLKTILATPSAKKYRRKAGIDELDTLIEQSLSELNKLEKSEDYSPDSCADLFGKVLANVFSYGYDIEKDKRVLYNFGFHIGRWIYLLDAADDYEKDTKRGSFNPYSSNDEQTKQFITNALNMELSEAEKAMLLIESKNRMLYNIIENVLYVGMPKIANQTLYKKSKGNNK